jgi:hypothetical protein
MRHAEPIGDTASVVDILSGTAGALAAHGLAVVVELERDADYVIAGPLHQRGRDRAVDAAGHGDDDAGITRLLVDAEAVHGRRI